MATTRKSRANVATDHGTGLDALDPTTTISHYGIVLRRIIAARKAVADADAELYAAVQAARRSGDSWAAIGFALDTTRQAAFQRFGKA